MPRVAVASLVSSLLAEVLGGCLACDEDHDDTVFAADDVAQFVGPGGEITPDVCTQLCDAALYDLGPCEVLEYPTDAKPDAKVWLPAGSGSAGTSETGAGDSSGGASDEGSGSALGNAKLRCPVDCVGGRAHESITTSGERAIADPVARHLARAAHDEAASVLAFIALAQELSAHDAPPQLLARLDSAAHDETRHAHVLSQLALAHGAQPAHAASVEMPVRSLVEIAIENAQQGCVNELWCAIEALVQMRTATDPTIRAAMRGIASDELRHAQLAWDLDDWLCTRLDADAIAEVASARALAVRALMHRIAAMDEPPAALGRPDRTTASRLIEAGRDTLWG